MTPCPGWELPDPQVLGPLRHIVALAADIGPTIVVAADLLHEKCDAQIGAFIAELPRPFWLHTACTWAGLAAADMLRREGYQGSITMISADEAPPSDRPNLSKDYLAGTASEDWIPLRPPDFYKDRKIDLVLSSRVASLDGWRAEC